MRPRRPTLLIALAIAAVIVVVAVAAYLLGSANRNIANPPPTATAPILGASPSGTPSTSVATDSAPTGCLGGPSRSDSMVLAAQKQAPHTSFGAVEVATAFFRWAYRYPYPSAASSDRVSAALIAPNASSSLKDIAAGYASAGDITHGEVPEGTPFYLSTAAGMWLTSGTPEQVLVTVNANYVIDGAVSPTKTAAAAAVMVWSSQGWRVLSEQQPDTAKLSAGGTQFTGGC